MKKTLNTLVWPILAAPLAYLALVWNRLPEQVAIHFNLEGTADDFGSKQQLVIMTLILTAINAGVYLLLKNIHRIDPKRGAGENKNRLQRIGFAICLFIAALLCMIIYTSTHNEKKFNTQFIFAGVGLLFSFIGNYMYTLKPNYFAGLRLPWTLENEDNWRKTHQLAGKLFFAGGLLIAVICLFTPVIVSIIAFFTICTIIVLIPCIYSYRLYKQQQ